MIRQVMPRIRGVPSMIISIICRTSSRKYISETQLLVKMSKVTFWRDRCNFLQTKKENRTRQFSVIKGV